MIRPLDLLTLGRTKLRARRIRTGFTVLISGLLFGLLLAVLLISDGILDSVQAFGREGVGEKYIVSVQNNEPADFQIYTLSEDPAFVARVQTLHDQRVAAKKASALAHKIDYVPAEEDPSPVVYDKDLKQYIVSPDHLTDYAVVEAQKEYAKPFDISARLKPYDIHGYLTESLVAPTDGQLLPMVDGKEALIENYGKKDVKNDIPTNYSEYFSSFTELAIEDDTLAMPYAPTDFDPSTATAIPLVVPYAYAEKALKLKKLPASASAQERVARIKQVRAAAQNLTIDFCYRNNSSLEQLNTALATRAEMEKNKDNKDYAKPSLLYEVPPSDACGAVPVASDTRAADEKTYASNLQAFNKEFGAYQDPLAIKLHFQVVGLSPSLEGIGNTQSLVDGVTAIFASNSVPHWQIPAGYFVKLPAALKPTAVFGDAVAATSTRDIPSQQDTKIVEFSTLTDARKFLNTCTNGCDDIFTMPYANSTLIMDDIQSVLEKIIFWVTAIISFVAIIILGSMIGRTIADGRRETAVFRAIGAKRIDITAIYTCYTLLLSLHVIVFVALLGIGLAWLADVWLAPQITPNALISFGAQDLTKQFHLIGFTSPYLIYLPLIIIGISLAAMLIPLLTSVRRNPIHDMRQE